MDRLSYSQVQRQEQKIAAGLNPSAKCYLNHLHHKACSVYLIPSFTAALQEQHSGDWHKVVGVVIARLEVFNKAVGLQ